MPVAEVAALEVSDTPEAETPVGGGRVRGLILHKLMEEVLTGEIEEEGLALTGRAGVLMRELVIDPPDTAELPSPAEIAATVINTLKLPDIAALRPILVPEVPIYGMLDAETALAGRADATVMEAGAASAVGRLEKRHRPHARGHRSPRGAASVLHDRHRC